MAQPLGKPTSTKFAMLFGRAGAGVPRGIERGSGGMCWIYVHVGGLTGGADDASFCRSDVESWRGSGSR